MSKIKKIMYIMLISIAAILGMYTVSKGYYVGQDISVSYWDYEASRNILCLEHGQRLHDTVQYTIISNVKIEGTVSKDHKGKTVDSWYNAKNGGNSL